MKKIFRLKLDGMTCDNCANTIREALNKTDGVYDTKVDRGKNQAEVTAEDAVNTALLVKSVEGAGYKATAVGPGTQ